MNATAVTARVQRRARARLPASSWGLADQALLSATSFVTMILVARALTPAAFGAFTLLYATLLFANGLHNTLVTQPHNILGVNRTGHDYRRYTTSTWVSHVCIAAALGGAALLTGAVAAAAGRHFAPLFVALAAASVAWLAQEFVRRVLYTERRFRSAVANDVISYGGQAVLIAALWRAGELSALRALLAIAITSAIAFVVGAWQVRHSVARAFAWKDITGNWHFGKWLAGGFIAYWFASQLYLYLAAALLGTAATGTMNAALLVMGPLNVVLVFVDTTMPIVFARTLERNGLAAMQAQLRRTATLLTPAVGLYCFVVAVLAAPLLRLFYGGRYAGAEVVLVLFALHYFVMSFARLLAAGVGARRLTQYVFKAQVTAAVAALTLGWMFIVVGGVRGAVVGTMVSGAISGLVLLRGYRSHGQAA